MSGVTIHDIVNHKGLEGLRLVAGMNKKSNVVHNVNIIDNPDSFEWFTAGDLLLTTGYIFKEDSNLQRRLIKELHELNCSGLGIKIKRYWDEIPKTILNAANRYQIPVIEIPYRFSLAQVSNIINDEIYNREHSELRQYKKIYDTFTQCFLSGGNQQQITHLAAEMVNNPVMVLDSRFNLLCYYDFDSNPYPIHRYIELKEREKPFDQFFNASIPTDVEEFTLSIKRKLYFNETEITCRIIPIKFNHTIYGYIVVWETMKKLQRMDYIALENAAISLAMERIKVREIEESKNRQREDFFDDLIEGRIYSNNAFLNIARNYGFNPEKPYVVLVCQVDHLKRKESHKIVHWLNHFPKLHTTIRYDNIYLLIELKDTTKFKRLTTETREMIHQIADYLEAIVPNRYIIGVSNICDDLFSIHHSVLLALDVIKLARTTGKKETIAFFTDYISYHFLDTVSDRERMLNFFNETLGALYNYDLENDSELLQTLSVYFDCLGNITQTAKTMYIHRNTIVYRLEKIKEILNTTLLNAEENFNFQLALKIYRLLYPKHE